MKKVIIFAAVSLSPFLMYAQLGKLKDKLKGSKTKDTTTVVSNNSTDNKSDGEYGDAVGYVTPGALNPDFKIVICKSEPSSGYPDFKAGAPCTKFKFVPYQNTHAVAKCYFNIGKNKNITQVDIRCYLEIANGRHEFADQHQLMMSAYKVVDRAELSVQKPGTYEVQVIDFQTKAFLYSTKFVVE